MTGLSNKRITLLILTKLRSYHHEYFLSNARDRMLKTHKQKSINVFKLHVNPKTNRERKKNHNTPPLHATLTTTVRALAPGVENPIEEK